MNPKFYDLNVNGTPEEILNLAKKLEWDGICLTKNFDKNFGKFCDTISRVKSDLDILLGAELGAPVQKNARKALEKADIIIVNGTDEEINRKASECWEVDILSAPELAAGRDFMHQKDSGIDHVMAKFMTERGIALEINLSQILGSYGLLRSQIMGKIQQNVLLARKFKTPMILTSGARDRWGLRAPRELMAIGKALGMTPEEAKAAVSQNPATIIQKAKDRKDPKVITKGLKVLKWSKQKPEEKRKYGWY